MSERMNKIGKRETIIVLLFSIGFVFGTLLLTGTIVSGYHLVDDHEIIRRVWSYDHTDSTFYAKFFAGFPWAGNRFRPLYTMVRSIRCFFLRDNFVLWSVIVGLEISFSIFYSYLVARLFQCRPFMSILFGLLIVVGEQSAVWWRLGPQEPTGLLLLMISIWMIQQYELSGKKVWVIGASCFSVLSSWSKEAFTLFLPVIPMLAVAYDIFYAEPGQTIWKSLRKNLILVVADTIALIWNLYQIVFKVGILSIGYAGIDKSMGKRRYLLSILKILNANLAIYFYGLLLVAVVAILYLISNKTIGDVLRQVWLLLLICMGSIGAQLVLHAKGGMGERYLIPSTVAIAMIAVIVINRAIADNGKLLIGYSVLLALLIGYLWCAKVYPKGVYFAEEGEAFRECCDVLEQIASEDNIIVSDLDKELNKSIESYLKGKLGYQRVFSYDEKSGVVWWVDIGDLDVSVNGIEEADFIIGSDDDYGGFEPVQSWNFATLWRKLK